MAGLTDSVLADQAANLSHLLRAGYHGETIGVHVQVLGRT
jgi:hypothetical protein